MSDGSTEVVELEPARREEVARVLADAFLDDPAWVAIGPARERARLRLLRAYYRVVLREAGADGGPSWCALRDGAVVGVAVTYADGLAYPPRRALIAESPPFLGPAPGPRSAARAWTRSSRSGTRTSLTWTCCSWPRT